RVVAEDAPGAARGILAVAEGEGEHGAQQNPRGIEQPAVMSHAVRYHSRPMTRDDIARKLVEIVRKEKQVADDKLTESTPLAEAVEQAGLSASDPHRFGVIIGTGMGGAETLDASYRRIYAEGQSRLPPTSIAWTMYNAPTSAVAARYGAKGIAYAVVSACSSS